MDIVKERKMSISDMVRLERLEAENAEMKKIIQEQDEALMELAELIAGGDD